MYCLYTHLDLKVDSLSNKHSCLNSLCIARDATAKDKRGRHDTDVRVREAAAAHTVMLTARRAALVQHVVAGCLCAPDTVSAGRPRGALPQRAHNRTRSHRHTRCRRYVAATTTTTIIQRNRGRLLNVSMMLFALREEKAEPYIY